MIKVSVNGIAMIGNKEFLIKAVAQALPAYVIRLQRIYNFLLSHVILLSVWDVLYALIC